MIKVSIVLSRLRKIFEPPLTEYSITVDTSNEKWMSEQWAACKECFAPGEIKVDYKMAWTCGAILSSIAADANADEASFSITGLYDKSTGKALGDWDIQIRRREQEGEDND